MLTCFDWDDTILGTTFLQTLATAESISIMDVTLDHSTYVKFKLIDSSASQMLTIALNFGSVIIVTNADIGWIEATGPKFVPMTFDLIKTHKITVLSASGRYRHMTDCHTQWKFLTMCDILPTHQLELFVSVGDSLAEKKAASQLKDVCGSIKPRAIKTVKMIDSPSLTNLHFQQNYLSQILPNLYTAHDFGSHIVVKIDEV